jgi:hypothetical protein
MENDQVPDDNHSEQRFDKWESDDMPKRYIIKERFENELNIR